MNPILFILGLILIIGSLSDENDSSAEKKSLLGSMRDELDEYDNFEKSLRKEVENG